MRTVEQQKEYFEGRLSNVQNAILDFVMEEIAKKCDQYNWTFASYFGTAFYPRGKEEGVDKEITNATTEKLLKLIFWADNIGAFPSLLCYNGKWIHEFPRQNKGEA